MIIVFSYLPMYSISCNMLFEGFEENWATHRYIDEKGQIF